jgi:hypothetical protein
VCGIFESDVAPHGAICNHPVMWEVRLSLVSDMGDQYPGLDEPLRHRKSTRTASASDNTCILSPFRAQSSSRKVIHSRA